MSLMSIEEMGENPWSIEYLKMLRNGLQRYDQAVEKFGQETDLYGYVCESLMGLSGDLVFAPKPPENGLKVSWVPLRDEPFHINTDNESAAIALIQAYTQSIPLLATDPMPYTPIEQRQQIVSKFEALEAIGSSWWESGGNCDGVMLLKIDAGCPLFRVDDQGNTTPSEAKADAYMVRNYRGCPVLIDERVFLITPDFDKAKEHYDKIAKECLGRPQQPVNGVIDSRYLGLTEIPGAYCKPEIEEVEILQSRQFAI